MALKVTKIPTPIEKLKVSELSTVPTKLTVSDVPISDLIKPPTIPAAVVAPTLSTPVVPPAPPTPPPATPTPTTPIASTSVAPPRPLTFNEKLQEQARLADIRVAELNAPPTVGQAFGSLLADETPEEKALREERERIAEENRITGTTEIDEAQLRQDVMDRFQAEIDSLNALFEERKREERISGTGRLGTERAIQSRRGLLGSSFGVAGKGRVEEFNIAKLNLIAAEQQNAVQVLLGNARKIATQELKDKNEARAAGTDAFVAFLEGEVARKAAQIDQVVNTIITREIDIDAMSEEELDQLAKDLGVSAEQILDAVRAKLDLIPKEKPTKGVILKPGETLLDPITGEEIGSVPAAPEDVSVPVIQKFGGNVNQWDPSTNTWKILGTEKEIGLDNFTNSDLISMAKAGLTVNAAGEIVKIAEPVNEIALAEAKEKVTLIDSLLIVDDGLDVAVGPNKGARFSPFEIFSAKRTNFVAGVEQLVSKESLESLIAAKAKGATFGALSDTEMAILRSAATKIAGWRIDKDGNAVADPALVAGYKTTQEAFLKELNLLREKTASIISLAEQEKAEQAQGGATGDTIDLSNDQFFDQDFSIVGSDTNQAVNKVPGGENLQSITLGGRTVKVDSQIKDRLARADAAMFAATKKHIIINEGFRSLARQKELFDRFQRGEGGRAAPPGQSFHNFGLAIDIRNVEEAESFLRAEGLMNELADDRGHFSIGEFTSLA